MTYHFSKGARALATLSVFASAFAVGHAQAENKLFPTDVLDAKQIDVAVGQSFSEFKASSHSVDYPEIHFRDKILSRGTLVSLRMGVGAATHVEASLSHGSYGTHETGFDGFASFDARDHAAGFQGGRISVLHGFMPQSGAFTLAAGLSFENQTSHSLGERYYNTARARVDAGLKLGSAIKAYGSLSLTFPQGQDMNESQALELGLWTPLSQTLTVVPAFNYSRYDGSKGFPDMHTLGLSVKGIVQLDQRSYLLPSLSASRTLAATYEVSGFGVRANGGNYRGAALGFYHLF